ncbi:hypothetical protein GCK72_013970 [Caenorhabditis remanei]|uniref:C2H2-type domain-containing protein n=1 Tax=Caenorhabditis remanei TaxID=31234 RepID=A0A6A5GS79_CAERE|nr:hypothetical protein GCK72_013970 [Caenorhabditis remanei]KAF1757514.1 hypothetical protein GCK72_013970 [Caenorhabditis remanei]
MPKVAGKKFVLISIDDEGEAKQNVRKLRRYLVNHKLKHVFSSDPDEIKEFLEMLNKNTLVLEENFDLQEEADQLLEENQLVMKTSSNQEILEKWARGTFSEDSDAIQLLFGSSLAVDQEKSAEENHQEPEEDENTIAIPPLFTVPSLELETFNETSIIENGKEENKEEDISNCLEEFRGVEISKRYQCLQCFKTLPVSKSPCEHISDQHVKNETEVEFRDLWCKEQLSAFNLSLAKCFGRQLPVPRSRRIRNEHPEAPNSLTPKASYRIVQGDEVVQIDTVFEKSHTIVNKSPDNKDLAGPSTSLVPELEYLTDEEEIHLYELDSEDYDASMRDIEDPTEKINADSPLSNVNQQ